MNAIDLIYGFSTPIAGGPGINIPPSGGDAKTGLIWLFYVVAVPVIVLLFLLLRFVYKNTIGKKMETTLLEDYMKEAEDYEKKGKFVSAADVYENRLKDRRKAAALYEKGGAHHRAALLYESLGMPQKAKEMYEKHGDVKSSAEVSVGEGKYEEAAKLYDRAGEKIDAAMMLERAGRNLAAIRAYREAGEYRRASVLLEREGMDKEAVEMFGLSLADKAVGGSNIGDYYTYASKLEKIGEMEKALGILREIDKADPSYKDVREKIHSLSSSGSAVAMPEGTTSLRSFIKSGKIGPKHGLKLWVQVLRKMQEAYKAGRGFGLLSPDNVAIGPQNNISLLNGPISSAYRSPEVSKGEQPDIRSDIYASGVMLYEILTGGLDGLGSARVIDIAEDVPDWLDEIVIKCIRKVREDRYQSLEEIFIDLKNLSKNK
jgi:tetratricopeptide (TPR) repeat protein